MKRLLFTGVVVAASLVAASSPAAASWQQDGTPSPAGLLSSSMAGVSCPASMFCIAVGTYTDSGGTHALAEQTTTGSTWSLQTVPAPTGATSAELGGVDCLTTSSCVAVGDYFNGSSQLPLVEVWNGSSWSVRSAPNPSGGSSTQLGSVSCTSASSCTAVGDYMSGVVQKALVEVESSGTWSVKTIPLPTGTTSSQLSGVSCPASSTCTIAGSYSTAKILEGELVETSNGSNWAIQSVPSPKGPSSLDAVSCSASNACTVVGYNQADRWNGSSWQLQSVPTPSPHSGLATLEGVSCPTSTACYTVGGYYVAGVLNGMADMWDGTKWVVQNTPLTTSYEDSGLQTVSCWAATFCDAVGSYLDPVDGNRAWIESFALQWQMQNMMPAVGAVASSASAVSCPHPATCMAVDSYETSGGFGTSTQQWNGSYWINISTPSPFKTFLSGVSCTTANACTAIGDMATGGTLVPLAERWDGASWKIQPTPGESGAQKSYLVAVSCTTSSACMAVGSYTLANGHQFPFTESWNGSKWTVQAAPAVPKTTDDSLNWVSCAKPTSCVAVGSLSPSGTALLIDSWNGTKWVAQTAALPTGGSDGSLAGVDCVSSSECLAVGGYFDGSHIVPLGERWESGKWHSMTMAMPHGVTASGLEGISCGAANSCDAVGYGAYPSGTNPFAEEWDGTRWTLRHAATPGAPSTLVSISCPIPTVCEAVGWYTPSGQSNTDLAEQWS